MSLSGAECGKEVFEVCDSENRVIGTELRSNVHKRGLFHRAVNILVWNSDGQLLLQQRAPDKDVCPSRWDLSVGEHLKVGEAYEDAARRGLAEELGIKGAPLQRVRGVHLHSYDFEDVGLKDREFNELWQAAYGGEVVADGVEVTATRLLGLQDALAEMERDPEAFTPWCHAELRAYADLLAAGDVQIPRPAGSAA